MKVMKKPGDFVKLYKLEIFARDGGWVIHLSIYGQTLGRVLR